MKDYDKDDEAARYHRGNYDENGYDKNGYNEYGHGEGRMQQRYFRRPSEASRDYYDHADYNYGGQRQVPYTGSISSHYQHRYDPRESNERVRGRSRSRSRSHSPPRREEGTLYRSGRNRKPTRGRSSSGSRTQEWSSSGRQDSRSGHWSEVRNHSNSSSRVFDESRPSAWGMSHESNTPKQFHGAPKKQRPADCTAAKVRPDLRVQTSSPEIEVYNRKLKKDDVVVVPELFGKEEQMTMYNKLVKEFQRQGIFDDEGKMKGNTDFFTSTRTMNEIERSELVQTITNRLCKYFGIDKGKCRTVVCVRKAGSKFPLRHGCTAYDRWQSAGKNITVRALFGAPRETVFERAADDEEERNGVSVFVPQPNNSAISFCRDVDIKWKNGLTFVPKNERPEIYSVIVIVWGYAKDIAEERGSPPLLKGSKDHAPRHQETLLSQCKAEDESLNGPENQLTMHATLQKAREELSSLREQLKGKDDENRALAEQVTKLKTSKNEDQALFHRSLKEKEVEFQEAVQDRALWEKDTHALAAQQLQDELQTHKTKLRTKEGEFQKIIKAKDMAAQQLQNALQKQDKKLEMKEVESQKIILAKDLEAQQLQDKLQAQEKKLKIMEVEFQKENKSQSLASQQLQDKLRTQEGKIMKKESELLDTFQAKERLAQENKSLVLAAHELQEKVQAQEAVIETKEEEFVTVVQANEKLEKENEYLAMAAQQLQEKMKT